MDMTICCDKIQSDLFTIYLKQNAPNIDKSRMHIFVKSNMNVVSWFVAFPPIYRVEIVGSLYLLLLNAFFSLQLSFPLQFRSLNYLLVLIASLVLR